MALIQCPECNKQVSDSAKTCPHCGFQLIEDKLQDRQNKTYAKPKKKYRGLGLLLFLVALIIIVAISSIGGGGPTSNSPAPGTTTSSSDKFLAYNYAEDFVEKQLKSPSSAKFPKTMEKSDHIRSLGGGKFKINSWVDSQNAFGATIRTNFSCIIIFEGDKVRCENLIFDE